MATEISQVQIYFPPPSVYSTKSLYTIGKRALYFQDRLDIEKKNKKKKAISFSRT